MDSPAASRQVKQFHRGEKIYRTGAPATHLYLVESGLVSLAMDRGDKLIELFQVPTSQLFGEEALWGSTAHAATAIASNETWVVPIPAAEARAWIESASPLLRLFTKSALARQKATLDAIREIKLADDPIPCPPERITRLFAAIYHAARSTGTVKGGNTVVVWLAFKKYCLRAFLESPVRLEQAITILANLGLARLQMIPSESDPEAPEELGYVHFPDLAKIQGFIEFHRQTGRAPKSAARPDELHLRILQEIENWNRLGKVEAFRRGELTMRTGPITTRTLARGEPLLKPGERFKSVYVIQSGRISICQKRDKGLIEIHQLTSPHSIGEETLFGGTPINLLVFAMQDTVLVEVPMEMLREQIDAADEAGLKPLLKPLLDRGKSGTHELRTLQTSRETLPCPADETSKIFGVILHSARATGSPDAHGSECDSDAFFRYVTEVFGESPARVENALGILVKLGYAELSPGRIHFLDLKRVEDFVDYFGSYHFKGGHDAFLRTDAKTTRLVEELLKFAHGHPVDRAGNAYLPFKPAIEELKKVFGKTFEGEQLFRLEQKGLFMKRIANDQGGTLTFYKPDYEQMLLNWKILKEVEIWNETGLVGFAGMPAGSRPATTTDSPEQERARWSKLLTDWMPLASAGGQPPVIRQGERAPDERWCPVCMSVVNPEQKLCHVCGAELGTQAA